MQIRSVTGLASQYIHTDRIPPFLEGNLDRKRCEQGPHQYAQTMVHPFAPNERHLTQAIQSVIPDILRHLVRTDRVRLPPDPELRLLRHDNPHVTLCALSIPEDSPAIKLANDYRRQQVQIARILSKYPPFFRVRGTHLQMSKGAIQLLWTVEGADPDIIRNIRRDLISIGLSCTNKDRAGIPFPGMQSGLASGNFANSPSTPFLLIDLLELKREMADNQGVCRAIDLILQNPITHQLTDYHAVAHRNNLLWGAKELSGQAGITRPLDVAVPRPPFPMCDEMGPYLSPRQWAQIHDQRKLTR